MNSGIHTVIYPGDDLGQAKALYQALLGTEPYVDDLKDLLGRLRETGASQQGEVRDVRIWCRCPSTGTGPDRQMETR